MQKLERTLHRMAAWLLALMLYIVCVTIAYAVLTNAIWPNDPGKNVHTKGSLTLDVGNARDGYILAQAEPGSKRYKMRVTKDNAVLMYDLNSNGQFEVFPLQLGSGKYSFELFRNVDANKYAQAGSIGFTVELKNEYAAFLLPNQYVPYDQNSPAVRLSDELCSGLSTDAEKLEAVRKYVKENFVYDFVKASTIKSGTMPSIEYLMEKRMGICQDIAAFTACMLRVQGIPTQMVIGYANQNYHAWNNVLIDGEFRRVDLTAELNSVYRDVTYTVERYY